ncbi:MAG: hypothetical protein ACP5QN_00820 [Minisyncoccia bacterium]
MSIFKFGKKDKSPQPDETSLMLKKLKEDCEKESNAIEIFLNDLNEYNLQNFETLNMTLENFLEYIAEKKEEIENQMQFENNPNKINLLYQKIKDLNKIQSAIHFFISRSQAKIYNFPEIYFPKTKLYEFINILKSRQYYLKELLDLKINNVIKKINKSSKESLKKESLDNIVFATYFKKWIKNNEINVDQKIIDLIKLIENKFKETNFLEKELFNFLLQNNITLNDDINTLLKKIDEKLKQNKNFEE